MTLWASSLFGHVSAAQGVVAWIVLGMAAVLAVMRSATRRAGKPANAVTAEEQAKEDAAVAAFERYMEAEARFREMRSPQDRAERQRRH